MTVISSLTDIYRQWKAGVAEKQTARRMRDQALGDIQRFISTHCPRIAMPAGPRRKLVRAIDRSLTYITDGIDRIPGPVDLSPREWERRPALHAMFVDAEQIRSLLQSSNRLKTVFKNPGTPAAMALLSAEIHEKTIFGIEQTGEILRRDVPRKAVYFEGHQLLAPTPSLSDSRAKLQRLALVLLCSQTLRETNELAAWKKELEDMEQLLEFKLETAENPDPSSENDEDAGKTRQLLSEIKGKINAISRQTQFSGEHLNRFVQVFEAPEQHLSLNPADLKLDRLGVRLEKDSTEQADAFSIAEIQYEQMPKLGGLWVRIARKALTD